MFDFTNQEPKDAVVPLQIGKAGPWEPPTQYMRVPAAMPREQQASAVMDQWFMLWGAYRFTDLGGISCVVEARGMLQEWMHDFCGGNVASSFNVHVFRPTYKASQWSEPESCVSYLASYPYYRYSPEAYAALPELSCAYKGTPDRIDEKTARDTLARSLMFWACGYMLSKNRRGLVGADRTLEDGGQCRKIWHKAEELIKVPNFCLLSHATEVNPDEMDDPTRPLSHYSIKRGAPSHDAWTAPPHAGLEYADISMHDGAEYRNENSGNMVSFMSISMDCQLNALDDEYDPETDEYRRPERPEEDRISIPAYFVEKASLHGYARLFPRAIFPVG